MPSQKGFLWKQTEPDKFKEAKWLKQKEKEQE